MKVSVMCWSLFLIKLQAFQAATFLKTDSNTGVMFFFCETARLCEILKYLPVRGLFHFKMKEL